MPSNTRAASSEHKCVDLFLVKNSWPQSKVLPSGSRARYSEELAEHRAHYPLEVLSMSANLIRKSAPTVHTPNTGPPHLISTQDELFSLLSHPAGPSIVHYPSGTGPREGQA